MSGRPAKSEHGARRIVLSVRIHETEAEVLDRLRAQMREGTERADVVRAWIESAGGGVLVPRAPADNDSRDPGAHCGRSADRSYAGRAEWLARLVEQVKLDEASRKLVKAAIADLRDAPRPDGSVDEMVVELDLAGLERARADVGEAIAVVQRRLREAKAHDPLADLPARPKGWKAEAAPWDGTPPTPRELLSVLVARPLTHEAMCRRWPTVRGAWLTAQALVLANANLVITEPKTKLWRATPGGVAAASLTPAERTLPLPLAAPPSPPAAARKAKAVTLSFGQVVDLQQLRAAGSVEPRDHQHARRLRALQTGAIAKRAGGPLADRAMVGWHLTELGEAALKTHEGRT